MRELIIGTRNSKLALIQVNIIKEQLKKSGVTNPVKIKEIVTEGDKRLDVSLKQLGGSGVFLENIQAELQSGAIDFAVHSLKDVPPVLPQELHIAAVPEREDYRDAYLANNHIPLADLPNGAVIGTSSIRRAAQIQKQRPDIETKWIRGPIDSRINQMKEGHFDAIILAVAGIKRLGIGTDIITEYLPPQTFVPSPCQGSLAVECRKDDAEIRDLLRGINDRTSEKAAFAERAFLVRFNEDESAPVGGYAKTDGDAIIFHGMVISRDGKQKLEHTERNVDPEKAANLTAESLIDQGALDIIRQANEGHD